MICTEAGDMRVAPPLERARDIEGRRSHGGVGKSSVVDKPVPGDRLEHGHLRRVMRGSWV